MVDNAPTVAPGPEVPAAMTGDQGHAPAPNLLTFGFDQGPPKLKHPRSRKLKYLDHLLTLWEEAAAPHLRGVHAAFGSDTSRPEWKRRLRKEVGYRHRWNRLQPEDARAGVGSDDALVKDAVDALAGQVDGICLVPDRANKTLVGRPLYPGANPPNPFQWVPVVARHTKTGSCVWEMGPGVAPSAGHVAQLLGRRALLVQLPAPGTTEHHPRYPLVPDPNGRRLIRHGFLTIIEDEGIEQVAPELVLVPLPVPQDRFSIVAYSRMAAPTLRTSRNRHPGFAIWLPAPGRALVDQHPEFTTSHEAYLEAVVARVKTLEALVTSKGTRVCTSAPMVQGTPRAVEEAIRKATGWKVIDRLTLMEKRGARHAWDGTPLVGEALTVWGARP